MPIIINIRENPFFREVFEEGTQEGHQEGHLEGHQDEAVALLCRQNEHRFWVLTAATQQQIGATSLDQVLRTPRMLIAG